MKALLMVNKHDFMDRFKTAEDWNRCDIEAHEVLPKMLAIPVQITLPSIRKYHKACLSAKEKERQKSHADHN